MRHETNEWTRSRVVEDGGKQRTSVQIPTQRPASLETSDLAEGWHLKALRELKIYLMLDFSEPEIENPRFSE